MTFGKLSDRIRRIENEAAKADQSRITRAIRIVVNAHRADEAMSLAAAQGYDQPGDLVIIRSIVSAVGRTAQSIPAR